MNRWRVSQSSDIALGISLDGLGGLFSSFTIPLSFELVIMDCLCSEHRDSLDRRPLARRTSVKMDILHITHAHPERDKFMISLNAPKSNTFAMVMIFGVSLDSKHCSRIESIPISKVTWAGMQPVNWFLLVEEGRTEVFMSFTGLCQDWRTTFPTSKISWFPPPELFACPTADSERVYSCIELSNLGLSSSLNSSHHAKNHFQFLYLRELLVWSGGLGFKGPPMGV